MKATNEFHNPIGAFRRKVDYNHENNIFEHLSVNHKDIILLKGSHGLSKLADFVEHYEEYPLQKGSPMPCS